MSASLYSLLYNSWCPLYTFTFHTSFIVLDLQKYLDQGVRVKLQGGREVRGVLKGFDPLVNVVLDECIEFIRGEIACEGPG